MPQSQSSFTCLTTKGPGYLIRLYNSLLLQLLEKGIEIVHCLGPRSRRTLKLLLSFIFGSHRTTGTDPPPAFG